ncbi:ANTAR domain-containing protein [Terrabacter sp. BE26]|uniref:ANTAR domain-containing protein n=1 Tax=Terrabacter sp. BE26 TaxID=2898152 RepID=UPI0035BE6FC3
MPEVESAKQSPIQASTVIAASQSGQPGGTSPVGAPQGSPTKEELLGRLARFLVETDGIAPTVDEAVAHALTAVPCDWAVVAVTHHGAERAPRFYTASDRQLLEVVTEIAVAAPSSPGRLALMEGGVVHVPDLAAESRFGSYPQQMVTRTPVRSVLSSALQLRQEVLGVMTLYSAEADTFDAEARARASLVADYTAIAVEGAMVEERADNLEAALGNSRAIGTAIGVLVERHRITPAQAFEMLRSASQHTNRKLAVVAEELVRTGVLPTEP